MEWMLAGGEYEVQVGFGWTNGVVLDLLGKFASYDEVDHEALFSLPDILVQFSPRY